MFRRFLLPLLLTLCAARAMAVEQDLYNPLAVGLRWEVSIEVYPPGGRLVQGTSVREITGTQKMGRYMYFVVATTFNGLPQMKDFTVFRRKDTRGIYGIYSGDPEKREILESALPLEVGKSWKTVMGIQMITTTVEGKESIKVGDKTYENCVKVSYKSSDGSFSGTYYQAPDVGNVQETQVRDGVTYKFTLSKYSGLK